MNWNFYFSGILYAKIREETEALTARILDIETGNLGEERPFGEKENVFLQKLCSRSIAGFLKRKQLMRRKLHRSRKSLLWTGNGLQTAGASPISREIRNFQWTYFMKMEKSGQF